MPYDYRRALESLSSIAVVKQNVFEHSYHIFEEFKALSQDAAKDLEAQITAIDKRVHVQYSDINKNEFWLQFGGDLLIFSLHTNVFSFDRTHSLFSSNYIAENHSRAYFSMIEVFNFLNDSVKYDRVRDVGEMIGRIFINAENHFFIEGVGPIGSLFTDLSRQIFDSDMMSQVLDSCITSSINYDLWAPPFNEVRFIPVHAVLEKNGNSPRSTSKRLGFDIGS